MKRCKINWKISGVLLLFYFGTWTWHFAVSRRIILRGFPFFWAPHPLSCISDLDKKSFCSQNSLALLKRECRYGVALKFCPPTTFSSSSGDCEYVATWRYDEKSDKIKFEIKWVKKTLEKSVYIKISYHYFFTGRRMWASGPASGSQRRHR